MLIVENAWTILEPAWNEGTPRGLAAHSMTLVGDWLVVFGGKEETGQRTNRTCLYDLSTLPVSYPGEGGGALI